jgi:hypothetical protein
MNDRSAETSSAPIPSSPQHRVARLPPWWQTLQTAFAQPLDRHARGEGDRVQRMRGRGVAGGAADRRVDRRRDAPPRPASLPSAPSQAMNPARNGMRAGDRHLALLVPIGEGGRAVIAMRRGQPALDHLGQAGQFLGQPAAAGRQAKQGQRGAGNRGQGMRILLASCANHAPMKLPADRRNLDPDHGAGPEWGEPARAERRGAAASNETANRHPIPRRLPGCRACPGRRWRRSISSSAPCRSFAATRSVAPLDPWERAGAALGWPGWRRWRCSS